MVAMRKQGREIMDKGQRAPALFCRYGRRGDVATRGAGGGYNEEQKRQTPRGAGSHLTDSA